MGVRDASEIINELHFYKAKVVRKYARKRVATAATYHGHHH